MSHRYWGEHPATRRGFLTITGLLTGSTALGLTGCDLLSTEPGGQDDSSGGADGGRRANESPMLTQRVREGELPALEERLPQTPMVVQPVEEVGDYGGQWQSVLFGSTETAWLTRTMGYENLMRWHLDEPDGIPEAIPNVAASAEFNDDGTEYVITLRQGMKWSDGEPFTADDVVFAQNDVLGNTDLFPAPPWPATAEKVDGYTVRFTFEQPQGLFLEEQATYNGRYLTLHPRHYLESFHVDYNSDAEQLADEEDFDNWMSLFEARSDPWQTPELPSLRAWLPVNAYGDSERLRFERNPYYWKTDSDGAQLPYLDEVAYEVVSDTEVMLLKATNGELDMHTRHFNNLENKPVLARHREDAAYHFIELVPSQMNEMIIMLNLAHQDQAMRELFQDKNFRIGLSHAIDREEMIAAVYQRQGEPWQAAPRRDSEFFDEEFAKQYTEYDPDRAGDYLDQVGLTERDGQGFRLDPAGNRVSFTVETAVPALVSTWVPAMELVKSYWQEVGIDIDIKSEDRSLWTERIVANEHDAAVWVGPGGLQDAVLSGHHYLPYHVGSRYAIPWVTWYESGGAEGERPPEQPRQQLELYDELLATPDENQRHDLFEQILQISKEQFYVIGTVQMTQQYGILADTFHNVPESFPEAWLYPTPGPTRPEQYFIAAT